MMKRIIAILICLASVACVFAGCSTFDENEDKGQQLTVYLSDEIYNLDPAYSYYNESTRNVVSLMFDTLFKLDGNGKLSKSLVKSYEITEDSNAGEYIMYLTLNGNCWSDGTPVSANDVVYAWKRILECDASYASACLLYDIKNAREVKAGNMSIDDLGVYAEDTLLVSIQFETPIDYDQFLLNLTSLCLTPLREDCVSKSDEWSKKPSYALCSGPFKISKIAIAPTESGTKYTHSGYLVKDSATGKAVANGAEAQFAEFQISGFTLERNTYYYRDAEEDSIKKSVTPYKLVFESAMSDEDVKEAYNNGTLLYVGDIPQALRSEFKDTAEVNDTTAVNTVWLNENAEITNKKTGEAEKLFAIKEVRQALSMAINRQEIADMAVFAEVATGLVGNKVFATTSAKKTFRDACTATYSTLKYDLDAAKALLDTAKVTAKNYKIALTYAVYDDVMVKEAELVKAAWEALGFEVELRALGAIANPDYYKYTDFTPDNTEDNRDTICDDLYSFALIKGDYQAIILDNVATSVDAFSVLAPFAKAFSGMGMDMSDTENYQLTAHQTGYDSEAYNALIEKIYAEKKIENREADYLAAEAMLMDDMPVIPIYFVQSAYLVNSKLKNLDTNNYLYVAGFKKASLSEKDYTNYAYDLKASIDARFEKYCKTKSTYFYIKDVKDLDTFWATGTIYTFVNDYIVDYETPDTTAAKNK